MEAEKKYLGGWVMWVFFLMIICGGIATALNYAGIFTKTVIERKVFENSYQKVESMREAAKTYRAELALLRGKLANPNLDDGARAEIQAQIDAINILKRTKEN